MAVSTLELVEDLQARSDLTRRDASALVHTMSRLVEETTGQLVTRDQLDARLADLKGELRGDIAALRAEMKSDKADIHSLIRAQTQWFVGALIAVAGVAVAVVKLLPNAA